MVILQFRLAHPVLIYNVGLRRNTFKEFSDYETKLMKTSVSFGWLTSLHNGVWFYFFNRVESVLKKRIF